MNTTMKRALSLVFVPVLMAALGVAAEQPEFIGLGDSIGEGVQSADANAFTQPNTYLNLVARQMGARFPLPLIIGNPFALVGLPAGRFRLSPNLAPYNLAVSGADTTSILFEQAGGPIDAEVDLVQAPRTGSQIQIAEQLRAPFMICWIGNNDALDAVLSFDQLDASQLTPVPVFAANYQQIVTRLRAWNAKIVFGNIPNVAQIGFLFGPADLNRWLGSNFGLPQGHFTSLPVMLMLKLGLNNGSILQDPNFVLDAAEVQTIQTRVSTFNQIIAQNAAQAGMPVANINALFSFVGQTPLQLPGATITTKYNGGIFSLDGVHPSNFGHAVAANVFIGAANSAFGMGIPPLTNAQLFDIMRNDPFIDFDGDLRVKGRPLAGIFETLGPLAGVSGDDDTWGSAMAVMARAPGVDREAGARFMRAYLSATGRDPNTAWTGQDAIAAMVHVFGGLRSKRR